MPLIRIQWDWYCKNAGVFYCFLVGFLLWFFFFFFAERGGSKSQWKNQTSVYLGFRLSGDYGRIKCWLIWKDVLATDRLRPSRLSNLFLCVWLRFWPGHCNEGLLMCSSVWGLMCLGFGQPACKWFLTCRCCWGYPI